SDISGSDYTENVDTYFDRQTGALVKLGDNHAYSNPETVLAVTWQLISQNAWTGSDSGQELSWVVIVGVVTAVLIVLLIIGLVFRRRRKKTRVAESPFIC
ncbi:MAG TPA: LPXTG cell wall anchor domain-containing protein, partial [Candidatus Binatia bacterium]|nr:LPXTG cell wall anchor domain-containing protein [Candidatus Binatia bacterium]